MYSALGVQYNCSPISIILSRSIIITVISILIYKTNYTTVGVLGSIIRVGVLIESIVVERNEITPNSSHNLFAYFRVSLDKAPGLALYRTSLSNKSIR